MMLDRTRVAVGRGTALLLMTTVIAGCAGFRALKRDLALLDRSYLLSGMITNAADHSGPVWVVVVERRSDGTIVSGDVTQAGEIGAFAFVVDGMDERYVFAYGDTDGDETYDGSEPAWVYGDAAGHPQPVEFLRDEGRARVMGRLSSDTVIPADLLESARAFRRGRPLEEVITGASIPIALGEVVSLDEPRFSSERGQRGLWEPLSFPVEAGVGVFFLEPYDPERTPVLFVHGAGGSPHDWGTFFDRLDRTRYQPWFFFYPTGQRLDEMGRWLHAGVSLLHVYYGFDHLHLVAHSMGGLVARSFLIKHLVEEDNADVASFVSIATPWNGHAAAAGGVKHAPSVVPAWHDLAPDSEFLQGLFAVSLRDEVECHLLFTVRGSRSLILPPSNDGSVSVASQLAPGAQADAKRLYGFDLGHVAALSDDAVIATVARIQDAAERRAAMDARAR